MDSAERCAQGAHNMAEKNILKVIEPLFMDDLRSEFERVKARRGRLAALCPFQAKLGSLTFFDPASGCGKSLIVCRELRLLEIEVIRNIREATTATGQAVLDAAWQSVVDVDQFYGVELGKFPARITVTYWHVGPRGCAHAPRQASSFFDNTHGLAQQVADELAAAIVNGLVNQQSYITQEVF